MSSFDHGELNLPLHKRGSGSLDAQIDRWKREQAKEARAEQERRRVERLAAVEAEKARPKLSVDEVSGSRFVRDQYGWHRVVRVSAKSVTVETAYSWTDRIPLDRVLEVRS